MGPGSASGFLRLGSAIYIIVGFDRALRLICNLRANGRHHNGWLAMRKVTMVSLYMMSVCDFCLACACREIQAGQDIPRARVRARGRELLVRQQRTGLPPTAHAVVDHGTGKRGRLEVDCFSLPYPLSFPSMIAFLLSYPGSYRGLVYLHGSARRRRRHLRLRAGM